MSDKNIERRGLGRGLSALMGEIPGVVSQMPSARTTERGMPIERIAPNPEQPRRRFDPASLEELAASIREKGILQPIIVRRAPAGPADYQIVAGERRWRAAQMAQLHEVPVIIRDLTQEEAMEIAIIENIQRNDLDPIEEAQGYQRLMERHGRTQEEMATALGKSRSHIANMLRLLRLPTEVQDLLSEGKLTIGHARALITLADPLEAARTIIRKGLSVRETERFDTKPARKTAEAPKKDADTRMLEGELSAASGLDVSIRPDRNGSAGTVTIRYKSLEELDDLCRVLSSNLRGATI